MRVMKVNIVYGGIAFYFVSVYQIFFFDIYDAAMRTHDSQTRNFHATKNRDQCQRDFLFVGCHDTGLKRIFFLVLVKYARQIIDVL